MTTEKVNREARLKWVPIPKMTVSPIAQRDVNQARVDHLAANFDLEQLGTPTVNERDGSFFIIDGQHRIAALEAIGYGDQQVQCWCYEGLSDQEMAERFLLLNDYLAVNAFDRFTKGVHAGREVESDIDRIVRAAGLAVSRDHIPGAIQAVGTLRKVYTRSDPKTLGRALRIIRDAYGDPGLEAPVIDGIGHLCQRYNGELNDDDAIKRLSEIHGGVSGLLGKANVLHKQGVGPKGQCVAAAAVEIINRGRGGKKLPSWFKTAA